MRIIICDDDMEITSQLEQYIQSFFASHKLKVPEISIFHSGNELLSDQVTIQNLLIFVQYREIFKILLHPY